MKHIPRYVPGLGVQGYILTGALRPSVTIGKYVLFDANANTFVKAVPHENSTCNAWNSILQPSKYLHYLVHNLGLDIKILLISHNSPYNFLNHLMI